MTSHKIYFISILLVVLVVVVISGWTLGDVITRDECSSFPLGLRIFGAGDGSRLIRLMGLLGLCKLAVFICGS